jgi:epoxyqueuosine reductase QueG
VAFFSHKHAAYLAGMGSFGENNVLLTKKYGPRVRFTSIFTSATITGDPITGDDLCTHCERCVTQCPVNAIPKQSNNNSKKNYRPINKIACATRSKILRKDYKSPCGICIKVCPVGMDRKIFNREDMSIYTENSRYKKAWDHVKKYGSK